jgi:hypothetical protein
MLYRHCFSTLLWSMPLGDQKFGPENRGNNLNFTLDNYLPVPHNDVAE